MYVLVIRSNNVKKFSDSYHNIGFIYLTLVAKCSNINNVNYTLLSHCTICGVCNHIARKGECTSTYSGPGVYTIDHFSYNQMHWP